MFTDTIEKEPITCSNQLLGRIFLWPQRQPHLNSFCLPISNIPEHFCLLLQRLDYAKVNRCFKWRNFWTKLAQYGRDVPKLVMIDQNEANFLTLFLPFSQKLPKINTFCEWQIFQLFTILVVSVAGNMYGLEYFLSEFINL